MVSVDAATVNGQLPIRHATAADPRRIEALL